MSTETVKSKPSYNVAAMKAKIAEALNNKGSGTTNSKYPKQNWWKPEIGSHEVRILPLGLSDGEPVLKVSFYTKLVDRKRYVAPGAFGLPDPVAEQFEKKRKEKDGWAFAKNLKPQDRFMAAVFVRGQEDKKAQIWEMSTETRDQLLEILFQDDWDGIDLFDPDTGFDFTVSVKQELDNNKKPKTFKGFPCKKITLLKRAKSSPLNKDKAYAKEVMDSIPKLEEIYKNQAATVEELHEALSLYVQSLEAAVGGGEGSASGTSLNQAKSPSQKEAEDLLDNVFGEDA
jgi:hypothetical protein